MDKTQIKSCIDMLLKAHDEIYKCYDLDKARDWITRVRIALHDELRAYSEIHRLCGVEGCSEKATYRAHIVPMVHVDAPEIDMLVCREHISVDLRRMTQKNVPRYVAGE